jgi:hypothetical protein
MIRPTCNNNNNQQRLVNSINQAPTLFNASSDPNQLLSLSVNLCTTHTHTHTHTHTLSLSLSLSLSLALTLSLSLTLRPRYDLQQVMQLNLLPLFVSHMVLVALPLYGRLGSYQLAAPTRCQHAYGSVGKSGCTRADPKLSSGFLMPCRSQSTHNTAAVCQAYVLLNWLRCSTLLRLGAMVICTSS